MLLNEGMLINDTNTQVKSEMIRQLHALGRTDPDTWERAVFTALTGQTREDVDWEVEDNQAGYYTWVKTFDRLVEELIEDGFVRVEELGGGRRELVATEVDPPLEYNHYRPAP